MATKEIPMEKDRKSTSLLSADQLRTKVRFRSTDVPMLHGTSVRIRSLTEWQQSKFESKHIGRNGKPNKNAIEASRRDYIALCLVDEDGNAYLKASDLTESDSRLVNFLYRVCAEHNGLNEDEQDAVLGN